MNRKLFALSLIMALAVGSIALAQEQSKTVKIKGYLTDNMCAGEPEEDKDFEADAKGHAISCILMPHCIKSGFAVAEGRKLYQLDAAGNKLAEKALKTTKLTEVAAQ